MCLLVRVTGLLFRPYLGVVVEESSTRDRLQKVLVRCQKLVHRFGTAQCDAQLLPGTRHHFERQVMRHLLRKVDHFGQQQLRLMQNSLCFCKWFDNVNQKSSFTTKLVRHVSCFPDLRVRVGRGLQSAAGGATWQ